MSEAEANKDEAVVALLALGYDLSDANSMLGNIDRNLSTEERLKLALKRN
jgi:Holliday junction resolvasome RuvABC DNA-binding subunit